MSIINDLVNNTDECTKAWQLLLIRDQVHHKSLVDLIWKAIICSCIHERFDFEVCTVGNLNRAYQRRFSYDSQHLELFVTFPETATLFLRIYLYVKNMAVYYIDLNKTTVRKLAQWEKSELDNWSILNQTLTAYFQPCVLLSICCLIQLKIPLSLTNKIVRLLNPCGRKSDVCSITKQNKTQPDISTGLLGFFSFQN